MRLKNEHDLMKEIEHLHSVSRRLENERQELQIKFEQQTGNLETVLNCIEDFFLVVDSNARILKANNIVLSRLGYSREDLLHKNIVFIHAPERERELAYIFEDIRPGLTDTCHIPFVTRNGACIEVETRISRGFWDGAPVFLCISRDISLNKRQEEKIKAINESYERLTTYAGEAIFHILPDGQQVVYVNHAAEQLVGYKLAEWLSNPNLLWSLLHPDSLKDKVCIMERIKNGEDVIKGLSLKWVARDGREVITDITILAVRNEYGQIVYYESIARNITEQKRAEQALKLSEARYRMVVEDQSELICRFLIDGTIIFVNEAYCRYFNKTREELIGYSYYPAVPEEEQHLAFYNHLTLNVQKPVNTTEHRIIMPNGEVRWLQWSDRAILDRYNNIVEYQAVGRDITDSKNLEARLTYLSLHDALTGLYNRTYFDEEMKRLDNARFLPFGIIVADVNGLKIVNDTMGHQSGDELIRGAAQVLKESFRQSDVVARIGGDEFAILLPMAEKSVVVQSCERIKRSVEIFRSTHPAVPLSLAVGYALKEFADQRLEAVFAQADNEMYREKESRRESERAMIYSVINAAGA